MKEYSVPLFVNPLAIKYIDGVLHYLVDIVISSQIDNVYVNYELYSINDNSITANYMSIDDLSLSNTKAKLFSTYPNRKIIVKYKHSIKFYIEVKNSHIIVARDFNKIESFKNNSVSKAHYFSYKDLTKTYHTLYMYSKGNKHSRGNFEHGWAIATNNDYIDYDITYNIIKIRILTKTI
jgi:hypothetical protein